ncbi:MAG: monovalent cation/H+ antiporter subunit D family protein [Pseudomonadota bacterium]
MTFVSHPALLFTVILPFVAAGLNLISCKYENVREFWSFAGAVLTFGSVLTLVPNILDGFILTYHVTELLPGINISFRVDGLSLLFAGTSSFLWILAGFYCIGYMRGLSEHAQTRFYVCYSAAVGGAMGAAFSGNLFTLYLFYEIVSIVTYPLVAHHQDKEGYEGGKKYLIYLFFTSKAFLLPAMVIIYLTAGTLEFTSADIVKGIFDGNASHLLVGISYFLCLFGFAKAGIMPLHNWLPSAMVAPTPVSALLHAVVVVKVGVFSIARVMLSVFGTAMLSDLGLGIITAYIVSFTILAASLLALTQTNLKARLAYSTISQLSYIVLGVALLTPSGITGGLIHIANHAFSKITLFFCAGAIFVATGKKEIKELKGTGYTMPLTMAAFGLASLSMIGVPPVSGFVTKWFLAVGTMELKNTGLLVVLLVSSLLNAGYFVPILIEAYSGRKETMADPGFKNHESSNLILFMVLPILVTAFFSLVLGIFPDPLLTLIRLVVN